MNFNINEQDDFGFSLVSESELKAREEQLQKTVEEQSHVVKQTQAVFQNKIEGLMSMIMPLLNNLSKDPDKEYILWPDRAAKITAFKKKLQDYVNS